MWRVGECLNEKSVQRSVLFHIHPVWPKIARIPGILQTLPPRAPIPAGQRMGNSSSMNTFARAYGIGPIRSAGTWVNPTDS